MADRFIDFDAAWAEAQAASEPFTVTVLGGVYELPRSLPVKLVLFTKKWRDTEGDQLSLEFVIEHLGLLIGADEVQRWIDQGIEQAKLFEVYMTIVRRYRIGTGGDAEGEAPPPATGASPATSSTAGSSSRPTGPASTEGT